MTKPLYAYTYQEKYNLANDAIDSACLTIQHALLNDSNDKVSELFFTGENFNAIHSILINYIKAEIDYRELNILPKKGFNYD
jgi:hypothetical protein